MCGILGSINVPIGPPLLDLIRHRGPDSWGLRTFEAGPHTVDFGHRRLAIVDLSPAGHQPMTSDGDATAIVFNGEIYNHSELRRGLHRECWTGHSDTETLLHLIGERGIAALRDVNGIFALAFFDRADRKLYLIRDWFGVKPLYYWQSGNRLLFCSEMTPIQRVVSGSLDPDSLAEFLKLGYSPSPDTLLRHIRQVRPGHFLRIDLRDAGLHLSEFPYQEEVPKELKIRYEEAQKVYGELLEAAVRRQLMSDVEVGILLSGGIDSAVIAALAQKHSAQRLKSFTVGFRENDETDESQDARTTAGLLGLDHQEVLIGPDNFLDVLHRCIRAVESPLSTTSVVPMHHLAELAGRSVKVVLSGQGADEPLGGYNRYQGELWSGVLPRFAFELVRGVAACTRVRKEQILNGAKVLGTRPDVSRFARVYSIFDDGEILAMTGLSERRVADRLRYFYDLLGCERQSSGVQRMMSVDMRMQLADNLLAYTDKITMQYSLECRVPMLDLELVRFIEALPAKYRVRFGKRKIVHKDFARRLLPGAIVARRKRGFGSPTRTWFRRRRDIRDLLLARGTPFARHFDLRAVEKVFADHDRGYNREKQLFLLLAVSSWMTTFLNAT